MTKEVLEYSNLFELLLAMFILLCFVIYISLYFFFKKVDKRIDTMNKM